jgi:hypothetical protein
MSAFSMLQKNVTKNVTSNKIERTIPQAKKRQVSLYSALIAASCLHIVSFRALSTLYIKTHYQRWIVPLQVISMVNVLQILGSNPGWSMVNGL